MFPRGLPGFALLMLRASVALALIGEFIGHIKPLPIWLQGTTLALALALVVGYLTPIAAVVAVICHALIWSLCGVGAYGAAAASIVLLDALALSLLGPGAYSLDAYRFGRRVLVLPPP
jgi:uncharacterized membrane protein YphA (DoxX/SURF4 family)